MTFHSVPAGQGIFHSSSQSMSQVKRSCNIGRWNDHDKPLFLGTSHSRRWITWIISWRFPPVLPRRFDSFGVIGSIHWRGSEILLLSFGCRIDKLGFAWYLLLGFFVFLSFSPLWLFLLFALQKIKSWKNMKCILKFMRSCIAEDTFTRLHSLQGCSHWQYGGLFWVDKRNWHRWTHLLFFNSWELTYLTLRELFQLIFW